MEKKAENGSRYKVPNLERGLLVMELLVKHSDGLTQSEISSKLALSNSSVFRITMTLLEEGYLHRNSDSKVFYLSRKLLAMGNRALTEYDLMENSLSIMKRLRDIVRETVLIGTIVDAEGVVLEQVLGTHPFKFSLDCGARFPLHCAAPGKAILAYLPEVERENIIKRMKFTRFNERTITERKKFREELENIVNIGYALDRGEELTGIHCIAAPILNRYAYPVASIWTTGPTDRIRIKHFKVVGEQVKTHAMEVSRRLGYGLLSSSE